MKLLLIENDKDLAKVLSLKLRGERFAVDHTTDGFTGLKMAVSNGYDIVVTDLALPSKSGEQICTQLRAAHLNVPIIALTADSNLHTKLKLFDTGIDDYVTKPFEFSEFLARIKSCLRKQKIETDQTLQYDQISLDTRKRSIHRAGNSIFLRDKETKILEYMLMHPEQVLTREMILSYVWGPTIERYTNVVDVHIHNLRDKIDKPFGYPLIQTVNSVGYKICKPQDLKNQ